ncbi:MAG: oligopeptide transport system permease protein [Chloroflexota bacterium]|jgi:oligopeptide transport system permease protein|nr:oligopeptide transport system permease protein [Chloroflexota bacterium]
MATATASPGAIVDHEWDMPEQVSLWQDSWRRLRRNKLALVGLVIVTLALLSAVISPFWTPYETWRNALGETYASPSMAHPLGLDSLGRDILSRLLSGATVAITVGVGASALASAFGIVLGLIAGFYRGKVDAVISTFINTWYGVPDLLVAMTLVVLLGRGVLNLVIAIAITGWLGMARLVRGQTLSLREREFNEAARASGTRNFSIIFKHILPNALGPIIVQATYLVPAAIIFEAFLSLLGLGVPPPTPSWGDMASEGYKSLQFAPHVVLAPSIAISLTVLAFNWLGDGLRDAIDPRMRR